MNRKVRALVLVGASLITGAAMGVSPAQASVGPQHHDDVVGYFQSQSDCNWAGRTGEAQNRWNNADCDRVTDGYFRGLWELHAQTWTGGAAGHPGHQGPGGHGHPMPGWPGWPGMGH